MGKLEVDLEIVKCKIHEQDLQEDFKERLESELNNKYNNSSNNNDSFSNVLKRPFYFCKTAAAVFVCFMVLSSCAFADEIENMLKEMFCSITPTSEIAYENGDMIEINSDYQEKDGISMNVDCVSVNSNEINIALNLKSDTEYDNIGIASFKINDKFGNIIFDGNKELCANKYFIKIDIENIDKNNSIAFISISNEEKDLTELKNIELDIFDLKIESNNEIKFEKENFEFEINLENKKAR